MFIPVRLPQNAFDLSRSTREMAPALGKPASTADVFSGPVSAPSFPPGLRDVGGDLDRLLAGLAPSSPSARSQVALGLDRSSAERASVLSSTAPINTATSSYQKVQLSFGSSTSVAQVTGTYKGTGASAAARALTVSIDSGGIMGGTGSAVAFHVSDQTGATVFSFAGTVKAGQAVSLGSDIGLSLTFAQGSLLAGQSASTGVSRSQGSPIDQNALFNDADPNARPRFESGLTVGEGSFTLNGKTIAVKADDSISSVLQRISDEAPDIIASYDNQTITLTTRDPTRQPIVLSDDTSGFLAATKLQGAATQVGFVAQDQERLADSARFSSVKAGSFRVGNATVAVDPNSDTLASVLARMSQAGGITAFYDDQSDAVVLRGGQDATTLTDDTSGLLSALGLPTGRSLAPHETLSLDPGTVARLERATANQQAGLVEQTLAGPAFDPIAATAATTREPAATTASTNVTGALGSARKAKVAYGREVDDVRDKRPSKEPPSPSSSSSSSSGLSFWGKSWSTGSSVAPTFAVLPSGGNGTEVQTTL